MPALREIVSVFKLRIGVAIMLTGLAGLAVAPGELPDGGKVLLFALAILMASASAGAYNQFAERDLDLLMPRTRGRPFASGRFRANGAWLSLIGLLCILPVMAVAFAINLVSAMYVFLGAFTYGVVYTVWLKRRTWLNIVIGGLSGSFAVLGGAAVVDPQLSAVPLLLAVVLFLWTPPHFWSLAFVHAEQYRQARIPMLPVVYSEATAAWVIFIHTLTLVLVSVVPAFFGMGWIYLLGALGGGGYFLLTSYALVRQPNITTARVNFRASLIQLSVLLTACLLDVLIS